MKINWDQPRAGVWRASDETGRIVGRVSRTPLSLESAASVGYDDLGVYISEDAAKRAVEVRLQLKVPG